MAKLKKLAALCSAAIMALSVAGCSNTSYVMSSNGENVKAGVYLYNMVNTLYVQTMMMYYQNGITDNYFDQEVDGKKFSDYLSEQAMKSTKEYVAVVRKFDELGLELTDDELKNVNKQINDSWNQQKTYFENQGISKESIKLVQQASLKRSKIFDYYYAKGGIEEVSDDDINKYINENYLRYKQIYIAKSTDTDEDSAKKANEQSKKLRDEYLNKAKGLSFDEFDSVIDEYNAYVAAQSSEGNDTDSSAAEDTSSAAEDSLEETEDTSSAAESVNSADESVAETADSTVNENESSAESSTDSQAESESSDENSDTEENKYPNETMTSYGSLKEEELKESNGKMLTKIKGMDVGKAEAYEDDNGYYILIKGDVSERAAEYASENREDLIVEMKTDAFQALLDKWVEEADITVNDKAINRYTPEVVYKKYSEQKQ